MAQLSVLTLFACADVFGRKVNYELAFNGRPTLTELHTRVVEAFVVALDDERPGSNEPFGVEMLSVFSLDDEEWHEVIHSTQLKQNCQLYVFQAGHGDPPKGFPAPELPPHALPPGSELLLRHTGEHLPSYEHHNSGGRAGGTQNTPGTPLQRLDTAPPFSRPQQHSQGVREGQVSSTPRDGLRGIITSSNSSSIRPRNSVAVSSSVDPSFGVFVTEEEATSSSTAAAGRKNNRVALSNASEKPIERLFYRLDTSGKGFVTLSDLRDTMLSYRLDVSERSVGDTFSHGDHDISLGEFYGFGDAFPGIVSDLLRLMDRASPARNRGLSMNSRQQSTFTPNVVWEAGGRPQEHQKRAVTFAGAPGPVGHPGGPNSSPKKGWSGQGRYAPPSFAELVTTTSDASRGHNQYTANGYRSSSSASEPHQQRVQRVLPTDLSQEPPHQRQSQTTRNVSSSYLSSYSPVRGSSSSVVSSFLSGDTSQPRHHVGQVPSSTMIPMSPQDPHLAPRSRSGGPPTVSNETSAQPPPVPSHYRTIDHDTSRNSSIRLQRLQNASHAQEREDAWLREANPGGRNYSPMRR